MKGEQMELFASDPMEHLFPYWRESLYRMPEQVRMFRHNVNTTGWSMATQAWTFACHLLQHGQITRAEFRRWWRFGRRCRRWEEQVAKRQHFLGEPT